MAAENSVPWYLKKQSLVILLIVGFLSLAIAITSFVTAEGTWRIIAVIISSAIFFVLSGLVIRLWILDRRSKP